MRALEFVEHINAMVDKYGNLDVLAYGCNDQYSFPDPELSVELVGDIKIQNFFEITPKKY